MLAALLLCTCLALTTAAVVPDPVKKTNARPLVGMEMKGMSVEEKKLGGEVDEGQRRRMVNMTQEEATVAAWDWSGECPSGWTRIGARCFTFVHTSRMWADAEVYCGFLGANLASVHSSHEYFLIQQMIVQVASNLPTAWLGGYDAAKEGLWLWSNGQRFSYQIWAPNQPDNYRGAQHCLTMNFSGNKLWDDGNCDVSLPSVCAKHLPSMSQLAAV